MKAAAESGSGELVVLGISGGHDANWCVVRGGRLIGAWEKERFTRIRHDGGEVVSLVPRTLASLGMTIADIDLIATSEPVWLGTGPGHRVLGGNDYMAADEWAMQTVEVLGRIMPAVSVPHHLSHAAYAYYFAGFDEGAAITWDGGGDSATRGAYAATTVSSWRERRLEWLHPVKYNDYGSLWYMYSKAIFGSGLDAGKLMGLAALGTDALVEAARDRYLVPLPDPFGDAIGVRDSRAEWTAPAFAKSPLRWSDPRAADIAAAVQAVTLDGGRSLAHYVRRLGHANLALSGGVALNGYLNYELAKSCGFDAVFVPPAVHDGGIAVGAALFATHHVFSIPCPDDRGDPAFVGCSYAMDASRAAAFGSAFDLLWSDHVADVAEAAAEDLAAGRVIGMFQGRAEHGPRALGNRSFLADPRDPEMKHRLNATIKFREEFRPLAPIVLDEDVERYFGEPFDSPYMLHILPATSAAQADMPAALHVDTTARIQTVNAVSTIGQVVARFKALTGTGGVLNTSLNVKSPIVETPDQALQLLHDVPVDAVYLEGYRFVRRT